MISLKISFRCVLAGSIVWLSGWRWRGSERVLVKMEVEVVTIAIVFITIFPIRIHLLSKLWNLLMFSFIWLQINMIHNTVKFSQFDPMWWDNSSEVQTEKMSKMSSVFLLFKDYHFSLLLTMVFNVFWRFLSARWRRVNLLVQKMRKADESS